MSRRRKPSPGVCGVCGRAVVRPTPGEFQDRRRLRGAAGDFWASGHHYDEDDKLVEVRCLQHELRELLGWDWSEAW